MSKSLSGISSIYPLAAQLSSASGQTAGSVTAADSSSDPQAAQLEIQQNFNKILNNYLLAMSESSNENTGSDMFSSLLSSNQTSLSSASSATASGSSGSISTTDPKEALLQIQQNYNLIIGNFLLSQMESDEEENKKSNDIWGSLLSSYQSSNGSGTDSNTKLTAVQIQQEMLNGLLT